jgi:hypothetical protein
MRKVGWMYARLQTWFSFHIQAGLNGREWLARRMDLQELKYRQQGNGFVWVGDYEEAQSPESGVKTDTESVSCVDSARPSAANLRGPKIAKNDKCSDENGLRTTNDLTEGLARIIAQLKRRKTDIECGLAAPKRFGSLMETKRRRRLRIVTWSRRKRRRSNLSPRCKLR